jgi:hypothetical protein
MSGLDLPLSKPALLDSGLTVEELAEWKQLEAHLDSKRELKHIYDSLLVARDTSYFPLFDSLSFVDLQTLFQVEDEQPWTPPTVHTEKVVLKPRKAPWKLTLSSSTLTITPTI